MVKVRKQNSVDDITSANNSSRIHIRFGRFVKHSDHNRNLLYYHPKRDPSEGQLREKIEALCLQYPKYGYRRIRELLLRQGYTVSHRRVARFMKEANLSVSVKRACQTTNSVEGVRPWGNRLENLLLTLRNFGPN